MNAGEPGIAVSRVEDPTYTLRVWAVPVRLLLGAMWFWSAIDKMNSNLGGFRGMVEVMARGTALHPEGHPIGAVRSFLLGTVLPNWQVFGIILLILEFLVGVALLLGFATRLSAAIGIVLQILYWIGRGYLEWQFLYPTVIAAHLFVFFTRSGRSLGVDTLFSQKRPQSWLW